MTLVKSAQQKNNFLFPQPKHMFWVLKRTVSMRRFFCEHKTYAKKLWVRKYLQFYAEKIVDLNLCGRGIKTIRITSALDICSLENLITSNMQNFNILPSLHCSIWRRPRGHWPNFLPNGPLVKLEWAIFYIM